MPLMIEDQKPIIIYWSTSLFFSLSSSLNVGRQPTSSKMPIAIPGPKLAYYFILHAVCKELFLDSIILRQLGMGSCGETQGKCLNLFDVIQQHSSLQTISLKCSCSFSHFSR